MKSIKTLSCSALAVISLFAFSSCGGDDKKPSSPKPAAVTTDAVTSEATSAVVQCYDMNGNCLPEASSLIVDSIKIVYEHNPCEAVLYIRNTTQTGIANIKGNIQMYNAKNECYSSMDFIKSARIAPGETNAERVYLGDARVHPNQEWNRDVILFFKTNEDGTFSFVRSDNDWCECEAKLVSIRINFYEIAD